MTVATLLLLAALSSGSDVDAYSITNPSAFLNQHSRRVWSGRRCEKWGQLRSTRSSGVDALVLEEFTQLTVVDLKERLRELNLPVSGRKNELVERLNEYHSGSNEITESDLDGETDEPKMEENMRLEEDLDGLTVAELKERLKEFGLPVGGRKIELIERLKANQLESEELEEDAGDEGENADETFSEGDKDQNTINLDFSDDDDDLDADDDLIVFDESKAIKSPETPLQRRARRKKYWKTSEIRELIRAKDPKAVEKAEEMIATLEHMAAEENNEDYLPGPAEYTALIDAYANSGSSDAPQRAEKIIARIMDANEMSDRTVVTPTASLMDGIMKAYANLGTAEAAEQATAILNRMEYLREHIPESNCKPSVYSYGVAISAWTRVGSKEAAENAEAILNRLFEAYHDMLPRGENGGYIEELKPNSVVFNSVIDAWARSGSPLAGKKAEELLQRMKELSMLPEYDVRPDVISFNTCIKAWCNSNSPDAASKAEEILSLLESHPKYAKRDGMAIVRPTKLSYNTVINAFAKSNQRDSAIRAQDLLMRMIKSFKTDAFSTIKPDVVTFSSVLNALAKSRTVPEKADKCLAILKSMTDLHEIDGDPDTKPNIICYNTVLNAAAFSAHGNNDKKRALSVAVETFNQLRQGKYASPDAVSYGNMLKCFANLMPLGDTRTAMASKIFSSCVEEGLVGGMVLDEVRRSMPPDSFLKLLSDCGYNRPMRQRKLPSSVQLKDLPRKWTEKVKGSDMASRQRASFAKPPKKEDKRRRNIEEKPKVPKPSRQIVETAWISGKNL